MPSTHKKVIVRRMDRDTVAGFVASSFLADGKVELLNQAGKVVMIDLADIKAVLFVRNFDEGDEFARKTFTSRPRTEGLWLRLKFTDGETVEGMMPNDLMQSWPEGFLVNPPDSRGNVQRLFVPRAALTELNVLAVIGGGTRRRKEPAEEQVRMFGD